MEDLHVVSVAGGREGGREGGRGKKGAHGKRQRQVKEEGRDKGKDGLYGGGARTVGIRGTSKGSRSG